MSYFAEPNFIIYDEWFDEDLETTKLFAQNKKIKNTSNIHEYFYEQSNYKIGASENNMQLDIKLNSKELITKNYLGNLSERFTSVSFKNLHLFKVFTKNTFKFNTNKKLIYSLSIFGFVFLLGFVIFITQSKKSESNITNKTFSLEKGY